MIRQLLTLPITGPAQAAGWIFGRIIGAAEEEMYDEDHIVAQIRELAAELEAGHITEEQHARAEELLLERLVEARALRAEREETP